MHSELYEEKKPVNVYKLGELNDRDHQFSLNLMTLSKKAYSLFGFKSS